MELDLNLVGPEYFPVMGIDLLAARALRPADATGPPVAVVNRQLVRRYFAGAEPGAAGGRRLRNARLVLATDGEPLDAAPALRATRVNPVEALRSE